MKISVIIPNFNNSLYLEQCIESVFNQTYKDFECIVIDDGSTDNSIELLNQLAQKFPLIIFSNLNSGSACTRNIGISLSKGEYIAFLDSDDFWEPNFLESQFNCLIITNSDLVYANYYRLLEDGSLKPSKLEGYGEIDKYFLIASNPISTCSVLMKKSIIAEIGGFKHNLTVGQDLDLWFRVACHNYKLQLNTEYLLYYRIIATSTIRSKGAEKFTSNMIALEAKLNLLSTAIHTQESRKKIDQSVIQRLKVNRFYALDVHNIYYLWITHLFGLKHFSLKYLKINFRVMLTDVIYTFKNFNKIK